MPRARQNVVAEFGGGNVWVKPSRKGSGYSIFARMADGTVKEHSRKTESAALSLGAELGIDFSAVDGATPLYAVIHRVLVKERPEHWSEAWASRQEELARLWLASILGVAGRDLRASHIDACIKAIRDAGRGRDTERQLRGLWGRLIKWARRNGVVPEGRDLSPTTDLPPANRARRVHGEHETLITRGDLPTWEQLQRQARAASEISGRWWEELRVLWLALTGCRWGEHASLVSDAVDLDAGTVEYSWAMREANNLLWELPYGKTGEVRVTSWPRVLDEMLARRLEEVGPGGLVFPGENPRDAGPANWSEDLDGTTVRRLTKTRANEPLPELRPVAGTWAGRYWWRPIFQSSGVAAGFPVAAYLSTAPRRVSSLAWHPHDYRHWFATWAISPRSEDPARWFEGAGLSIPDAAAAIGDNIETFQRRYVGHSEHATARIVAGLRR